MSELSRQLILVIQSVHPRNRIAGPLMTAALSKLAGWLLENAFWPSTVQRTTGDQQEPERLDSLNAVEIDASKLSVGSHSWRSGDNAAQIDLSLGIDIFDLLGFVPLAGGRVPDLLGSLVGLSFDIWSTMSEHAIVGPVFSIRPVNIPYPRPRPPRHSSIWPIGDAAYFISDEFHREHALGDPRAVARLKERPLNPGIVRTNYAGLTLIRVAGPAEDPQAFARQLYDLEVWLSATLELPLHPEFLANGDQRLSSLPREEGAEPFTLYDATRRTGYKAVTESRSGKLDDATRHDLEQMLSVKKLTDGRPVARVMVIFPDREAAIDNAADVERLGAAGAVYVGDDRRLWNPRPPGDWIEVDWENA